MTPSVLFAMSLPGLLIALVVVAGVEQLASRRHRRSAITGAHRPRLGATGLVVVNAVIDPGSAAEQELRDESKVLRVESSNGTRVDLDAGTARI